MYDGVLEIIVSKNMVAEAELIENVPVLEHMKYHIRVAAQEHNQPMEFSSSPSSPITREVLLSESSRSTESSSLESVRSLVCFPLVYIGLCYFISCRELGIVSLGLLIELCVLQLLSSISF